MSKPKLVVTGMGPDSVEVDLTDSEVIIGRSVRAHVQVDGDLVSRQHARIYPKEGRWYFEDLGSRNGSLLNGVRTAAAQLKAGDIVMIGYGKLRFEDDTPGDDSDFTVSFIESPGTVEAAVMSDEGPGAEDEGEGTQATMALSYKDLIMVNQRIGTIIRISQQLATILDRDKLLDSVMQTLFDTFPQADRGCTVLRDADVGFRVQNTKQRRATGNTTSVMHISTSLINLVRRERKSVLSADTLQDDRFSGRESIVGVAGRSIMCAPLQHKNEFFGVIYLDTESLATPFVPADLNLLNGIAGPVAVFLKNAELIHEKEAETQMRANLSRYLSPDLVQQIAEGDMQANLGGDQVEGSVMFSDIVGFTAMSELLSAQEVVARLNRYFTSMLEAIFGWDGTVDKFGGDAVIAVWGAPLENERHALLSVGAALDMQARLFVLNLQLKTAGENTISMAVGINSGRFVAGNIGGAERMEWTVIGDNVNLAQRVESEGWGGCVLVAPTTYTGLRTRVGGYLFPPVQLKGKSEPVRIYSIRALETPRGVVTNIPARLASLSGAMESLVTKAKEKGGRLRITLASSGEPQVGEKVRLTVDLPEHPGAQTLDGKVAASSPLLDASSGRSVEVDVERMDPELQRLLTVDGVVDATVNIGDIER